jgi:hypothetical protein
MHEIFAPGAFPASFAAGQPGTASIAQLDPEASVQGGLRTIT